MSNFVKILEEICGNSMLENTQVLHEENINLGRKYSINIATSSSTGKDKSSGDKVKGAGSHRGRGKFIFGSENKGEIQISEKYGDIDFDHYKEYYNKGLLEDSTKRDLPKEIKAAGIAFLIDARGELIDFYKDPSTENKERLEKKGKEFYKKLGRNYSVKDAKRIADEAYNERNK